MKDDQKLLYLPGWNSISQAWQPDGSCIVTLSKQGDKLVHVLHVADLYGPDEKVLTYITKTAEIPPHIADRIQEVQPPAEISAPVPDIFINPAGGVNGRAKG
jgi:hypothetical protein